MSTIKVDRFENTTGVAYGMVIQTVNYQTGAVATGTTLLPVDDTVPQNTEGTEFMTLAITPKSATNKLKITVTAFLTSNVSNNIAVALFQDSTAAALSTMMTSVSSGTQLFTLTYSYYMTAGTTSSTTFKVRAGGSNAATITFNGTGGSRLYGGTCASSITIEEIQV